MSVFKRKYFITDRAVGQYVTRRLSAAEAESLRSKGYLVEPCRHE